MRRRSLLATAGLLATPRIAASQGAGPPHAWLFGTWLGGVFPPGDTRGWECFGNAVIIVTRDVVMRATSLDIAYRQRFIETAAASPDGLEIRFAPAQPVPSAFGMRMPEDAGFGCGGNPDVLIVRRLSEDEIALPGCVEFPATLRRCR
jgi:hypothetical protein